MTTSVAASAAFIAAMDASASVAVTVTGAFILGVRQFDSAVNVAVTTAADYGTTVLSVDGTADIAATATAGFVGEFAMAGTADPTITATMVGELQGEAWSVVARAARLGLTLRLVVRNGLT